MIYQLLPRLWGNTRRPWGNVPSGTLQDNGCGKFNDIDSKSIEYIKYLGFSHIWLTGILRHSTQGDPLCKGLAGSPYAISDYYDVAPYLAENQENRMQEFESLVERIHEAGLKVIIDFVPNHVSRLYKGELGSGDDTSVHWKAENDFFYYPGVPLTLPVESSYKEYPAKASGNCFSPNPDINDWWETIKLNYCPFHTPTWDKMRDIVRFWAGKGVDGFRCDMVELVPAEFFTWLIKGIKADFPSVIFIAEVYDRATYNKYVQEVGFDLLYDKSGLYDTLRAVLTRRTPASGITSCWQSLGGLQDNMLNFLENHDEQRIASRQFACIAGKGLAALVVSVLFARGDFMLYFGQEVGENASDAEGFSAEDGRTSIFDWWNIQSIRDLRRAIDTGAYKDMAVGSLVGCGFSVRQAELFCRYAKLLRYASTHKTVPYDLCWCNDFDKNTVFAFLNGPSDLVVCNFSDAKRSITINIPSEAFAYYGADSSVKNLRVIVPANDFTLYENLSQY